MKILSPRHCLDGVCAALFWALALQVSPLVAAPYEKGPRVTVVPWAARLPEVLLLKTGSGVLEVGLTPMSPTQPLLLGADRTLGIMLPSTDPARPPEVLFEFKVPVGVSDALLIVSPESEMWKSVLFRSDARSFPAESLLLVNVAPVAAMLKAGDQVFELQPGEHRLVQLQTGKTRRTFVRVALQTAEGWGRPAGSPINLPDGGRGLVLVGRSDQSALAASEASVSRREPQPRLITAVDMPPADLEEQAGDGN